MVPFACLQSQPVIKLWSLNSPFLQSLEGFLVQVQKGPNPSVPQSQVESIAWTGCSPMKVDKRLDSGLGEVRFPARQFTDPGHDPHDVEYSLKSGV